MREILFRGKRTDNGKWVKGDPAGSIRGAISKIEFYDGLTDCETVDVIPETVGQFTGLTDRNGVKIFEGDIVEYSNVNYEIKYIEGFAAFSLRSVDNMNYAPCITTNTVPRMSVIGNIHENHELLEERNE